MGGGGGRISLLCLDRFLYTDAPLFITTDELTPSALPLLLKR